MLTALAVANYRSIKSLLLPLAELNIITGANGVGKSNAYKALRLLAETAQGGAVATLAREGGLTSTLWAGPEVLSRRMKSGDDPVQGGPRNEPVSLHLGFCTDTLGYAIDFGLPTPSRSLFTHDPEIKRECIFAAPTYRPSVALVDRRNAVLKSKGEGREWIALSNSLPTFESMLSVPFDSQKAPELLAIRDLVRHWRFYDHFRVDADAPARQPVVGTRTTVLAPDGRDLASALETIREIGDARAVDEAIEHAFPGSSLEIVQMDGRLQVQFSQPGLLRPLSAAELSDGTLRYLLWIAALLTPRPPTLMVLNEPETSLHPDLLPALAGLIKQAAKQTQVWVVSHAPRLISALSDVQGCNKIVLDKPFGETEVIEHRMDEGPSWKWPER